MIFRASQIIIALKSLLVQDRTFEDLPRFATISHSLNKLRIKDAVFLWSKEWEIAFQALKHALVDALVLVLPILGKPYIIHTDASTIGLGACLLQVNPETSSEHLIAHCSRRLRHERNCATITLDSQYVAITIVRVDNWSCTARKKICPCVGQISCVATLS